MNVWHIEGQTETTMTEKGRIQRSKFAKGNGDRHIQKKMDDCIYTAILYIFVMVITHRRFRTEVYNIKQEESEAKQTKINQNKENRNTWTRKQWKH